MLLLEGREEAAQLCRHYGLQLNTAGDAVLLTGTSRIQQRTDADGHPVLTPLFRLSLIEAKRRDVPVCRLMMSPTVPPALLALAGEEAATALQCFSFSMRVFSSSLGEAAATAVLPSPRAMLNSPNATAAGLVDRTPSVRVPSRPPSKPGPSSACPGGATLAGRPVSRPVQSGLGLEVTVSRGRRDDVEMTSRLGEERARLDAHEGALL